MKNILYLLIVLVVGIFLWKGWYRQNTAGHLAMTPTPQVVLNDIATQDSGNPQNQILLEIIYPPDGSRVNESSLLVKGHTVAGADVFVNDQESKADASGNFSQAVSLVDGDNTIDVAANNDQGDFAEKEIVVTLETNQ